MKKTEQIQEFATSIHDFEAIELEDQTLRDVRGADCGNNCECNSVEGCGPDHNYVLLCGVGS